MPQVIDAPHIDVPDRTVSPETQEKRRVWPRQNVNKALLLLRAVVGLLFIGHGLAKMFGWFGGQGIAAWTQTIAELGLQPAPIWAYFEAGAEVAAGLLLVLGQRIVAEHDLVAVAPGGKFTDGYNVARNLLAASVALSQKVPVVVLHHSVGPIEGPAHRQLLADVLSRCHLILARDSRSAAFLRELGIPPDRLWETRDAVLAEQYPPPEAPVYDLGINIRTGPPGHLDLAALSWFLVEYARRRSGARVLVYSTSFDLPPQVVDLLGPLPCGLETTMPGYPNFVRAIGRCAVNVSDSFHGALFSMLANRPVVCCRPDRCSWKLEGPR